ncbi:chromosomal replication initiator protein [Prosthecobacter fusiformis]|uniref:Chromosomal replication initiator protein DnaA n=1 Tax=Prosthecobacter fusiformis TaxID=48464 RepID=A0A4R7RLM7_9BACT|nr:chromosomal replication initiator protein DnaA [Prosthecobacter fusiformis]TDU64565.1 chromosomal replication initiator protein [Prosthecobacter fusiformis]
METDHEEHPAPLSIPAEENEGSDMLRLQPTAWDQICTILLKKLGQDNFQRCFSGTTARIADGHRFIVNVPNPIHQLWIESNFAGTLADAAAEVLGTAACIEYSIANDSQPGFPVTAQPVLKAARVINTRQDGDRPLASPHVMADVSSSRSFADAGLNLKFNFDSFVVGSNCSYSAAVARAVSEKPGRIYNPLFFYGATGLGKTHLMQAIGQEVLMRKKKAIVRYVTSEQFTNEFVEAIKKHSFTQFRQKYRKVDVLLIDDVHFFEGKDSTQEEFFHTFNELFNNAKQIVLASDRPPSDIKNLESRLVSRFEWGLTTQIQTPDFETRVAILRRKMSDFNVALDPWILEFIAQRVRTNVRRLEGALMRVAAHVSLEGTMLNESALAAFLHDVIDEEPTKSITVDRVQRAVANQYDLRVSDLTGPRRPKNIAEARQVAMYLTRHMVKLPLIQIGEEFGGRDHGTVIHACKVITQRMSETHDFRAMVDRLSAKLKEA